MKMPYKNMADQVEANKRYRERVRITSQEDLHRRLDEQKQLAIAKFLNAFEGKAIEEFFKAAAPEKAQDLIKAWNEILLKAEAKASKIADNMIQGAEAKFEEDLTEELNEVEQLSKVFKK